LADPTGTPPGDGSPILRTVERARPAYLLGGTARSADAVSAARRGVREDPGVQERADARPAVVAVVGPTASGKSDLGVALALALGGEVVNADSMQLYRGMDVGTAKLAMPERRGVPHHLLDVWDVTETASVADYQHRARAVVDELRGSGRTPVLVGGSGLYVRAVLDHLEFPGTDAALRARLEAELADVGPGEMHRRLAEADPEAAAAILAGNGRRIVRALEVVELTGGRFTATLPEEREFYPSVRIGLDVPRPVLDARIDERVQRMWVAGLVEEVRRLVGVGLREGVTASRALGYAQVLRMLDGELTEEQALEETQRATRRFARRQDTWFRRDDRILWLPHDAEDLVEQAVSHVGSSSVLP
jgi:tRNA dimethylallyltransferase